MKATPLLSHLRLPLEMAKTSFSKAAPFIVMKHGTRSVCLSTFPQGRQVTRLSQGLPLWNFTIQTQYGEEYTFKAVITNLSGRSRRFSLEGLPIWITASQYNGVVDALGELPITFTISPYINIGNFDEVIYLVGEDEMTEPLPLSIKVRGEAPNWVVDDKLLQGNISMSIIGQVSITADVEHDKDDMLAAFNSEHRLLGVTHLDNDVTGIGSDGLAYLTIYNEDYSPIVLFFEFYDASQPYGACCLCEQGAHQRWQFRSKKFLHSV